MLQSLRVKFWKEKNLKLPKGGFTRVKNSTCK